MTIEQVVVNKKYIYFYKIRQFEKTPITVESLWSLSFQDAIFSTLDILALRYFLVPKHYI